MCVQSLLEARGLADQLIKTQHEDLVRRELCLPPHQLWPIDPAAKGANAGSERELQRGFERGDQSHQERWDRSSHLS